MLFSKLAEAIAPKAWKRRPGYITEEGGGISVNTASHQSCHSFDKNLNMK